MLRLQRYVSSVEAFAPLQRALLPAGAPAPRISSTTLQIARVLSSVFTLLFISTGLIYTCEHEVNPQIPDFFVALYFGLTTLTTVGFGDITPRSDAERAVAMVAVVAGTGFYSYVIGSVSAIVASIDAAQRVQIEKMDLIYSYMRARRFPTELRVKITKYFKLYFEERTALNLSLIHI